MTDNYERLKLIIQQHLQPKGEIHPFSSFAEDLGADSLDLVEILMACEEEFDIEVPDKQAEKLKTVDDVLRYIEDNKK